MEATGRRCIAVKADTADREAMDALVARAEAEFGRVDIAVANAGVSVPAPITSMTSAQWNEVISSNLTGVSTPLRPCQVEWRNVVTVASSRFPR